MIIWELLRCSNPLWNELVLFFFFWEGWIGIVDNWFLDKSRYFKETKFPKEEGILPWNAFVDMTKYSEFGKLKPKFVGSEPRKLLAEISMYLRLEWRWYGTRKGPVKELLFKKRTSNLVFFSNNEEVNLPSKLLSDR